MSEAREVGDRQTEAIINHDIQGVVDFYSDDAVMITPEGRFAGKEAIRGFIDGMLGPFSDIHANTLSKFDAGAKSVDEWIMKMKNTAPLTTPDGISIPATNREIELHGADVYEVHDGHITEHHMYYDQAEMMKQLGVATA